MATKSVNFFGERFDIEGLGQDDPYFASLSDTIDSSFAQVLSLFVPRNGVAFDIGANIGVTSCMLGAHLRDGTVFSFEPSPSVFPVLERNIARNKLVNVNPIQNAIGAEIGELGFAGNSAYGHLVQAGDNRFQEDEERVKVTTVDAFLVERHTPRVDLVKIDVEGFEYDVLQGLERTEKEFSPLYFMELNSFCISAYRDMNPLDFIKSVLEQFEYVFLVSHDGGFDRIFDDPVSLLHTNIVTEGSVSNLLMTNAADRLKISSINALEDLSALKMRLKTAESERSTAIAQRDEAIKQRDDALKQLDHARRYPWKYLRAAIKQNKK